MAGLKKVMGSALPHKFAGNVVGAVSPEELLTVTVMVKPKENSQKFFQTAQPAPVTRENFEDRYGADPDTLKKIADYAKSQGLLVVESDAGKRRVVLTGKASLFEKTFDVKLGMFEHDRGTFRAHTGEISVPEEIHDSIESVLGLSDRPIARPHFQYCQFQSESSFGASQDHPQPLTPPQVADLYHFPKDLDGSGQCVAIIELGGGYILNDLRTYFQNLGVPMPEISTVSVLGATNRPGSDADGEVALDIEVIGAIVPKAKIVVYFAPNTNQGFVQAVINAAHDKINKPSVISISWGGPENYWTLQAMTSMSNAIRDAGILGVTVTVAAGDEGSDDGVGDGRSHVDFPASSPYALACGGTRLIGEGDHITSESVWNDGPQSATGGGVSDAFSMPTYQNHAHVPKSLNTQRHGRGLPDVTGVGDPETGLVTRVDGVDTAIGGTSAVAPLWAALITQINQKTQKPLGFCNPLLYQIAISAQPSPFHKITQGDNGAWKAGAPWNPCAGWGSPDGTQLLAAVDAAWVKKA